jgi:hypothetical protein
MFYNFLGNFILGITPLASYSSPTPFAYNKLEVFGGNTRLDYVQILNRELTESEIMSINIDSEPIWDGSTIALATFEGDSLAIGNITGLTNPILGYFINRRTGNSGVYNRIGTSSAEGIYNDWKTGGNSQIYEYQIIAYNNTQQSNPIYTSVTTSYYGDYIIDESTGQGYIADWNIERNDFTNEVAFQRYDGFNKYSAYSVGKRNFLTTNVSAIINLGCDGLNQPTSFLEEFRSFINNGNKKIYKTRKGEVYNVVTYGCNYSELNISIRENPYLLSFEIMEVGE